MWTSQIITVGLFTSRAAESYNFSHNFNRAICTLYRLYYHLFKILQTLDHLSYVLPISTLLASFFSPLCVCARLRKPISLLLQSILSSHKNTKILALNGRVLRPSFKLSTRLDNVLESM